MSDKIDFWEIREGDEDDWDSVCLVKTLDDAAKMTRLLLPHYDRPLSVHHVEVVADTNLTLEEY